MIGRKTSVLLCLIWFLTVAGYAQTNNDVQDPETCGCRTATLVAKSTNARGYQWYKDNVKIDGAVNEKYVTNIEGLYSVVAYNQESCPSESSNLIRVSFKPPPTQVADLQIVKTSDHKIVSSGDPFEYTIRVLNRGAGDAFGVTVTDVLPQDLIMENTPPAASGTVLYDFSTHTITWQIDQLANGEIADLKLTTRSKIGGMIENTATVEYVNDPDLSNNSSTDRKEILAIKIPNVFTPNGDNINDSFIIENLDAYQDNDIVILNRWGNHVYEKKNYQNEWTGEGLSEGTYFYVLTLKTFSGKQQVLKGYVTLLRSKN